MTKFSFSPFTFLANPQYKRLYSFLHMSCAVGMLCSEAAVAQDSAPIKNKEWTYQKKTLAAPLSLACVASTEKKVGQMMWSFQLVVDPSKKTPPSIFVSTTETAVNSQLALQTDTRSTQFVHLRASDYDAAFGKTAYWFAPATLSDLVKQIRRDSALKVNYKDSAGKAQHFNFSLSGSMAILDKLTELCDSKKDLLFLPFFDYLDQQPLPTERSNETGVAVLQNRLNKAWETYFQTGQLADGIKQIDAQMKPLMDAEKNFLTRNGRLTGEIQAKTRVKTDAEGQKATFVATRAQLDSDLKKTERDLIPALATLKEKEDLYRPAAQEAQPFIDSRNTAQAEVNEYISDISQQESRISSAQSEISRLQSQMNDLTSRRNSLESELGNLRSRRAQAQSSLNSFNFDFELRRLISQDSRYRSLEDDVKTNERNIGRLNNAIRDLNSRLFSLESQLRSCQAVGTQDCSSIESELRNTASGVNAAQNELDREQRDLSDNERDLDRRRVELESDVNNRRESLVRVVQDLDEEISSDESSLSQIRSQLDDIRASRIPAQEFIVSDARGELASLRPLLQSAQRNLTDKQAALEAVLTRNGYRAKRAAYEAASNVVDSLRSQAASLDRRIKDTDTQINKLSTLIAKTQGEIDVLMADLAKSTQELQLIEAQLDPLRAEKTALTAQLNQAQAVLKDLLISYKGVLRDTVTNGTLGLDLRVLSTTKFHDWN